MVTRNPSDGVWVSGLPGEMPGTPYGDPYGTAEVGDAIASPDDSPASRVEKLGKAFCERADDILDIAEKRLDSAQKLLGPQPTHTEVPVHVTHYTPEVPYHEIDAGSAAAALMALGVAGWGMTRMVKQWRE